ncbi:hypothetical protein [Bradyrhizobium sp. SZCCHNR3118]|uniref:hypothetical protein n=1 Tax=Bradyrhizobium sp. SZCCHNR3118 TaxID=3057468 RepID=UPI002916C62A|nr:hypothetical protein [Bradyrhizobium sp. SZCCHNR3118]
MSLSLDLVNRVAVHEHGFVIQIADLFDHDGDFTEDHTEAVGVGLFMPPDGIYITIDLRDLDEDDIINVQ